MSLQSRPYYWVTCDYPGCGVSAEEGGDYTAWQDPGYAASSALDSCFITLDDLWYCWEHQVEPPEDSDNDDRLPMPHPEPVA